MALNFLSDGYFAGNLGIGTDSPGAKLDIVTSASGSQIELTSPTPGIKLIDSNAPTRYAEIKAENGNVTIDIDPGGAEENSHFSIDIDNSEMLRITDDGKVGIGTDSPNAKLDVKETTSDVAGEVIVGGLIASDNVPFGKISFANTATANTQTNDVLASIAGEKVGSSNKGELTFLTSNSAAPVEKMRITSTGNVGIGTTDPKSKLEVDGGVKIADDTDAASVDKVGTMRYRTGTEYVEVTGTELVTNGDFATDSDWIKNAEWTISGGKANAANSVSYRRIVQNGVQLSNTTLYRLIFTVSNLTSGGVICVVGGTNGLGITANGTYIQYVTSASTADDALQIASNPTFTGSIDNVSLMEVTEEDASYADMCMQTGSSTYEWVNIVRNTY